MKRTIRIGTRESALALAQAQTVAKRILASGREYGVALVPIKTTGDRILDKTLEAIGGKGLFVKELDAALGAGVIDIAVHSYKDMPVPGNPDLPVVAVLAREDPRDVLVLPAGPGGGDLPLGTASPRRRAQLASLFPGREIAPIRGNIQTRLAKLDDGQYGALILAAAGLNRLSLGSRISRWFSPDEMLPAACQGMLAVQARAGEEFAFAGALNDVSAWDASVAERSFVETLGGGCATPIAAYAEVSGSEVFLRGLCVAADGAMRRGGLSGKRSQAQALGARLAGLLRTEGNAYDGQR